MKVRMTVGISGGRGDGTEWPAAGGVLEVDDAEGRALITGHLAVPVVEEKAEKAVPPEADVEKRAATTRAPAKPRTAKQG